MSFQKILEKYCKYSFSERDKGDRFESLMQAYLLTDPEPMRRAVAYEYVVNGKNAIEWIMERYQI